MNGRFSCSGRSYLAPAKPTRARRRNVAGRSQMAIGRQVLSIVTQKGLPKFQNGLAGRRTIMRPKDKSKASGESAQRPREPKHRTVKTAIVGFNYDLLPPDVAQVAQKAALYIKARLNDSLIEIGKGLRIAKKSLGRGLFGKWVRAEFGMTMRTAQRHMAAARLAAKSDTVSLLSPTALYALSAPTTPNAVRENVLEGLEKGTKFGTKEIAALIREEKKNHANGRTSGAAKQHNPVNDGSSARRQIIISCTGRIQKKLRAKRPPADAKTFLAQVHREGDRFVVRDLKPIRRTSAKPSK